MKGKPVVAAAVLALSAALTPPAGQASASTPLPLGAWIPHWRAEAGVGRALERLDRFSHLSPFSLRVQPDGSMRGPLRLGRAPWRELAVKARSAGVALWPTLVWADADARGGALASPAQRARHVGHVLALVERHDLGGVDLDYERKRPAEREGFSALVRELSAALHGRGRSLSCTIAPRTRERPPPGLSGGELGPWSNDYAVLGEHCDQVRLMAYDRTALDAEGLLHEAGHAPLPWVRRVVEHAKQRIAPSRLWLGVPTYGWELMPRQRGGFERVAPLSFPEFTRRVQRGGLKTSRSAGGELLARRGRRHLVMSDAEAVRARLALAREHRLGGAVLFKLDGLEDPEIWDLLP